MKRIKLRRQLTGPFLDKEAGWLEWLRQYNLIDDALEEEALYCRSLRVHKVTFGQAPRHLQARLFHDLLYFEPGLVFGDCIGLAVEFPFHFSVEDTTPIWEKPIQYACEERRWVNEYLAE